jgi:hypothetical protein
MDFQFGVGKTKTFYQITSTHPIFSHVAPPAKTTMSIQRGGDVIKNWVAHPCPLWDQ